MAEPKRRIMGDSSKGPWPICVWCNTKFPRKSGRYPKFCSATCKQRDYEFQHGKRITKVSLQKRVTCAETIINNSVIIPMKGKDQLVKQARMEWIRGH
jgi:hypothetical protein